MNTESEQPTILPWHREAAQAIHDKLFSLAGADRSDIAAIIARHDPHAETLRLLGEAFRWVDDYNCRMSGSGVLVEEIRAHLAAMKGGQS